MRRLSELLNRSPIPTWFAAVSLLGLGLPPAGHGQSVAGSNLSGGAGYPVRGSVVNDVTGQPVPRALVEMNADFATLTDGNGQFAFDNVPQHIYMVTVSKPGYLGAGRVRHTMPLGGAGVVHGDAPPARRVVVGPNLPNLRFGITPEGVIAGQVTLSTSDAPDGIRVEIFQRSLRNGRRAWEMAGTVTTRSDGSFRMGDLPPGSYMLNTVASMDNPGEQISSGNPVWGYPPVYYPGVTDPNSAGILTVGPGQQAEADFTMTHQQFFPVNIAVRAVDPGTPATVEILDPGGRATGFPVRYDPREQVAHASVPNGTWAAKAQSFGRSIGWGETTFQMASAPVSLALSVQQIPHVPVTIRRDFGATANEPSGNDPGLNLVLTGADGFAGNSGGYLARTPGGDNGSWQLNVTEPGRFWVEAMPFGSNYVSSITSGGMDLASNPLVVTPGSAVPEVDITLRDDSGSIEGQLTATQAGAAGTATSNTGGFSGSADQTTLAWIYAIPLFSTASKLPQGIATEEGAFTLAGLAPGAYRVVACDAPADIEYHSADAAAAWAGEGQTVTVEAGGKASASLALEHCEAGTP